MTLHQRIAIASLALGMLILILTIGDFLALHDIHKDYVSRRVLTTLDVQIPDTLPSWTGTYDEWLMVTASLISRAALLLLNAVILTPLLWSTRSTAKPNRDTQQA